MYLLAKQFVFVGVIRFSERWNQDLSNGPNVASQLANFLPVFTSAVYGHMSYHQEPRGVPEHNPITDSGRSTGTSDGLSNVGAPFDAGIKGG
jgi:hypothetical protein